VAIMKGPSDDSSSVKPQPQEPAPRQRKEPDWNLSDPASVLSEPPVSAVPNASPNSSVDEAKATPQVTPSSPPEPAQSNHTASVFTLFLLAVAFVGTTVFF